jgi:DNA-binding protein HU-beta
MNRTDIVRAVANKSGLPMTVVAKVTDDLLDVIGLCLAAGEEVNLRQFGKFEPRDRKAVVRKNPRTGEDIQVPAKTGVGFIPSPVLKQRLNR